jgi:hypothetical protein
VVAVICGGPEAETFCTTSATTLRAASCQPDSLDGPPGFHAEHASDERGEIACLGMLGQGIEQPQRIEHRVGIGQPGQQARGPGLARAYVPDFAVRQSQVAGHVVNRRTVVDQTTDEVERLRANSKKAGLEEELAISMLRGQMADNRAWSADPSRPAVICGTVDMIGNRHGAGRPGLLRRPQDRSHEGAGRVLTTRPELPGAVPAANLTWPGAGARRRGRIFS